MVGAVGLGLTGDDAPLARGAEQAPPDRREGGRITV
jgi:hypothetical protein